MTLFAACPDRGRLYAAYAAAPRLKRRMSFEQALSDPAVRRALDLDARHRALPTGGRR
ncbi:MAG: hypothetical protein AB7Q81_24465 [Gammaproteobacteria bacterium]